MDQADQGSVIRGKRWLGFRVCWESNNNSMRPDIYTKAVLTVIAVMLTVIAVKPLISPDTTASAQSGQFVGVQYGNLDFFDSRTGEVFSYSHKEIGKPLQLQYKWRVVKLGQPLINEYEGK